MVVLSQGRTKCSVLFEFCTTKAQLVVTAPIAQNGVGLGCSPYVTALFLNLFSKLMHGIDDTHNFQFSPLARVNKVIRGVFALSPG